MSTTYCTTVGVVDGMAWFEDGTSVDNVTVELISAAPDLLAALEEILDLFEWDESGGEHEAAYDSARAVIAKAKGGE